MLRTKQAARALGFTLVEILVAIAVLGVLLAIAVPVYRDYKVKSRVVEGLEFADFARIEVMLKSGSGGLDALAKNFNVLAQPTGHITSLRWVAVPNTKGQSGAVIGYLLPTMNLPELGMRDVFALEYLNEAGWRCVSASAAIGRQAISQNEALEDKYLPAACHGGAGMMAQPSKPPAGCPPGTQQVQTVDVNGKAQQTCQPVATTTPPQPQPQPQTQPKPQPQATPSQATACPVGQDCTHSDPKCPAGQMYYPGGQVPVLASSNPFAPATGGKAVTVFFTTQPLKVAEGCVAKCKQGFVFNPRSPEQCGIAPSTNNHICRGPKFICERAHVPDPAGSCPADAPYAATHVHNLIDGSRYVTRSCLRQQEAFEADRYNKAHSECAKYNVNNLQAADFKCTYACLGNACNDETVPKSQVTWRPGKTAADLPDQL